MCSQKWNKPNTLDSWFHRFRSWVDTGACKYARDGIDPFRKTIPYNSFKSCLQVWLLEDPIGSTYRVEIKFDYKSGKIEGWKQAIQMERIMDPGEYAMIFLNDIRLIEKAVGLEDTYSFDREYIEVEIYRVLMPETISTLTIAILTVIFVVLFITVNV